MEQIKIIWTDLALGSMDEIGAYIEQNFSTAIAQKSLGKIYLAVNRLSTSPDIGMVMPEMEKFGEVRFYHYKQNLIVYRKKSDHLQVVIIWDGRRSQEEMIDHVLDYFSQNN